MKLEERIIKSLRRVLNEHGGVQASAAKALGVSPPALYNWLNGKGMTKNLALINALETIGYRLLPPDEKLEDYALLPKVEAQPGAGSSLIISGEVDGYYAFRQDFLGRESISASKSVLMTVRGDSMMPTISQGDTVLVDQSDRELFDGRIYVFTLVDELKIKRIIKSAKGIILRSDNAAYPDDIVTPDQVDSLIVHGRVRWIGKVL